MPWRTEQGGPLPQLTDTCPDGTICSAGVIGGWGRCFDLCDASTTTKFGACRTGYKCQPFTGDPRFGYCTRL